MKSNAAHVKNKIAAQWTCSSAQPLSSEQSNTNYRPSVRILITKEATFQEALHCQKQ